MRAEISLLTRYVASEGAPPPPGPGLVLGPGDGDEVIALARLHYAVTAMDVFPWEVERLRARLQREGLHADLRVGNAVRDVASLPEDYALIVMVNFLCVLAPVDRHHVLVESMRRLKPEGSVFIVGGTVAPPPGNVTVTEFGEARLITKSGAG